MLASGFFSRLGRADENQLSRTVEACFAASPFFRHRLIDLLHDTCRLSQTTDGTVWLCLTQEPTPTPGGGRLDLRFSVDDGHRNPKKNRREFVIESKVESKLSCEQLLRYRDFGVHHLIAVTKHPPDARQMDHLRRNRIRSLRWQDVYHALSERRASSPEERFTVSAFLAYLEELNMAYPERLRSDAIAECRRVFAVATSTKSYQGLEPGNAFATADQLLLLLSELKRDLVERVPSFEKCRSWGPRFFVWRGESPVERGYHIFGFGLMGKRQSAACFQCDIAFPRLPSEAIRWNIQMYGSRVSRPKEKTLLLSEVTDRDKRLRRDELLRHLVVLAKRWHAPDVLLP